MDLLCILVLDEHDRLARGVHRDALRLELGEDDGVDMLDLDGDHVDQLGELADLDGICERARHRLAAHGAHRRVQAARIQRRHDHAEARGGLCHHAAQLAATEAAHVALIRENIDGLHRRCLEIGRPRAGRRGGTRT